MAMKTEISTWVIHPSPSFFLLPKYNLKLTDVLNTVYIIPFIPFQSLNKMRKILFLEAQNNVAMFKL